MNTDRHRCEGFLIRVHSCAFVVFFLLLSCVYSSFAREKWPQPTEEAKRKAEQWRRHEEEVWRKIEPEVMAWGKKGKPYIPSAARPEDLPQAKIPAFPGAEGAGRFSFGGR